MPPKPFLILDTPRGPDGTCWFVTEPGLRDEGLVAHLGTETRKQRKAGVPLVGADYVAVGHEAVQVRDNLRRSGQEILILAGLSPEAMKAEPALRQLLADHLSWLDPTSGEIVASDPGSSGLLLSGPVIRDVERDVLRQLPAAMSAEKKERQPNMLTRGIHLVGKAALVMVLAIVLAVVLVLILKPRFEAIVASWSRPEVKQDRPANSESRDPSFVLKDERWRALAQAYGLTDSSTAEQRTEFVKAIYRELRPKTPPPADLGGDTPPILPGGDLLLTAARKAGGHATARSVSAGFAGSPSEELRDLRPLAASFPDPSGGTGQVRARAIVAGWWKAFKTFHDQKPTTFTKEADTAWTALAEMEPVASVPFLTPRDVDRLAAMSDFLATAARKDEKDQAWQGADWMGKIAVLQALSTNSFVDLNRQQLFSALVKAVSDTEADPAR